MASLLRQIVAGPRARHPEAGLDLCYVTDNIVATSGPSSSYPQRAYRNPTEDLVKWLDDKHGDNWAIWEFRAEGTGYSDHEVYNRIEHHPWPDHHPPPFALIPNMMASMRNWMKGPDSKEGRIVVVHCKAGKGRSGTVACSYLISEEGWSIEDALQRFTARRMRNGFGPGLSIPSQVRWINYVDWWAKHGKVYVERQTEILEVHIWGLRDGVKIAVEGYVDNGKLIKTFHTFSQDERQIMDEPLQNTVHTPESAATGTPISLYNNRDLMRAKTEADSPQSPLTASTTSSMIHKTQSGRGASAAAALFRPIQPIILPSPDVNIDVERRNKAKYGLTMVTAVAHVWFNAYFESQYALQKEPSETPSSPASMQTQTVDPTKPLSSGVFSVDWDAMDGLKGSSRKGKRAFDRLSVVWRAVDDTSISAKPLKIVTEPLPGQSTVQPGPAKQDASSNLRTAHRIEDEKTLGLRTESPAGGKVSRSSSPVSAEPTKVEDDDSEVGIQPYVPGNKLTNRDKDANPQLVGVQDGKQEEKTKDLPTSVQKIPGQIIEDADRK